MLALALSSSLSLAACDRAPGTLSAARNLDICANESGIAAALTGGQLRITVQRADGTPVAAGSAAPDRMTQLPLSGASAGDLIVVEGVAADGAPLALGTGTMGATSACVCLARHVWRAFPEWTDAAGALHVGPGATFFVGTPPPGLVATTPLALDRGQLAAGDVQVASFGFTNPTTSTLRLAALQILARPPGATHASGLLDDFTPQTISQLAPGAEYHAQAMRTFSPIDPPGTWAAFVRYIDVLGTAHDGPEVQFLVGASSEPLVPSTTLRLEQTWAPSATTGRPQHADIMYRNPAAAPVAYRDAFVTARPPGGSDANGPYLDFTNKQTGDLAPGGTLDVAGDRPFTQAQNPCAGLVCTVQNGQCQLGPAL